VGLSDEESRYRLTSQKLLPQFGSARNPFSSRAKAESAQKETRSPENHDGNGAAEARPGFAGSRGEPVAVIQREAAHCVAPAKISLGDLARAPWRKIAMLLSGCYVKLCGLFARSGGKLAKSAIRRFPKPPVQGELSLNRIKVMRNDLSDADLEIVLAKPPVAPGAKAPAPRAVEESVEPKSAWGRVTARILGAGKT
jgi:hypothetical protein